MSWGRSVKGKGWHSRGALQSDDRLGGRDSGVRKSGGNNSLWTWLRVLPIFASGSGEP